MILDEPTAALDARAESRCSSGSASPREPLRPPHLRTASRASAPPTIYVLEHGKVVEEGSHDELMDAGGRYAELFTLQARASGPRPGVR